MNALPLCPRQFSHTCYGWGATSKNRANLGATYDDHLRLIGKHVVDFLLALIELFSLGVTAEALRAIIGWKSAISLKWGSVDPKFQVEGVAPHQPFFFSEN